MDSTFHDLKGIYHDRIITAQDQVIDLGWRSNIIVDRCRYLLAAFMRSERSARGIYYLTVGRGEESWDTIPFAPPQSDRTALTDPSPFNIRIRSGEMIYVDPAGDPSKIPTSRIQIRVTLEPGTPPISPGDTSYPLREFGLFGRLGKENYMIDYVRHAVIQKQAGDTLVRTIRLMF